MTFQPSPKFGAWLTKQPELLEERDIIKLNTYILNFHDNMTNEADLNYFYGYIRKILEDVLIKYASNQIILGKLPKFKDASLLFREIQLQNNNHKEDLKQISETLKNTLERYKEDASDLIK